MSGQGYMLYIAVYIIIYT